MDGTGDDRMRRQKRRTCHQVRWRRVDEGRELRRDEADLITAAVSHDESMESPALTSSKLRNEEARGGSAATITPMTARSKHGAYCLGVVSAGCNDKAARCQGNELHCSVLQWTLFRTVFADSDTHTRAVLR